MSDSWVASETRLHINYSSMGIEQSLIRSTLVFNFELSANTRPQQPTPISANTLIISDVTAELRQKLSNGSEVYIGHLFLKQPVYNFSINGTTNLSLAIELTPFDLKAIERARESKDLQLIARIFFNAQFEMQPKTRTLSSFQITFRIPKAIGWKIIYHT